MAKDAIKVETSGIDRLTKQLSGAAKATESNIHDAVIKFAFLIDRKTKEKIQKGTRSGKTRRRRSIDHTASAPGEPPKTDSGRLVSSIRPVIKGRMSAEVGSLSNIAVYGAMLEDGTKNMGARPWLEPTLRENESALQALFTTAIKTGGLAD